jgi:hypothetical protein
MCMVGGDDLWSSGATAREAVLDYTTRGRPGLSETTPGAGIEFANNALARELFRTRVLHCTFQRHQVALASTKNFLYGGVVYNL